MSDADGGTIGKDGREPGRPALFLRNPQKRKHGGGELSAGARPMGIHFSPSLYPLLLAAATKMGKTPTPSGGDRDPNAGCAPT